MTIGRQTQPLWDFAVEETFELGRELETPQVEDLLSALEEHGAVVAQLPDQIGVSLVVMALGPIEALFEARETIAKAISRAGVLVGRSIGLEVLDLDEVDRRNEAPAETYLGVTEVATLLRVSKQRVSELRTSQAFPAPVAELAAGPVWAASSLRRFIQTWERKPGRPRKVRTGV